MDQFSEIIQEYIKMSKNISIYSVFGRNRRIGLIDGSDEMVHRKPLRLSHGRPIINGALK